MKCYLGVDVGTTNTKVLALFEDGTTAIVAALTTPQYRRDGVEYFDVAAIERSVAAAVDAVRRADRVAGIGFSTIGESVVPLDRDGTSLSDPIAWYDAVTRKTAATLGERSDLFPYPRRGTQSEHTLAVYKILWMKAHLPTVGNVASWLPVSSYLPFRWSGVQRWDYSQACRTLLLDIHDRRWDERALAALGLVGELPDPAYMGSAIGTTAEGIPLYLGGHDHIVGMNGVRALFGIGTLYNSIGSAFVLGGMTAIDGAAMAARLEEFDDLIVGVANQPGAYYIENSIRFYGTLLATIARIAGGADTARFYARSNAELATHAIPNEPVLFLVEGDRFLRQSKLGFQITEVPIAVDRPDLVWSLYLYLVLNTRTVVGELGDLFDSARFVVGGGPTGNRVLMQLTADTLQMPLTLIQQPELSALGAALTAAEGAGDTDTIEHTRAAIDTTVIEPSERVGEIRQRLDRLSERMTARVAHEISRRSTP